MATKRIRKQLVVRARLADNSNIERTSFKSLPAAKQWAEENGAEITDHKWQQVTRWRGRYTDLNGKRPEATFDKKWKAEDWEEQMRSLVAQGHDPQKGRKTALAEWHDETWVRTRKGLSPSSRARDAWAWEKIEPKFGGRSLASIKRSDVKALASELMDPDEDGLAKDAVRRVVGVLSLMLQAAMEDDLIRSNPAHRLKLQPPVAIREPRRKPKSFEAISREETLAIYAVLPEWARGPFVAGVWAGLRMQEIRGVRRRNLILDVEIGSPMILVREVLAETGGHLERQIPKNPNAVRDVPLTSEAAAVFTTHLENGFAQDGDDGLVFTSATGKPLRRSNFAKVLGRASERSIGRWISPHDLRRSCGSQMIYAGIDVASAAAILGDEVETFMAHYTKVLEGGMDSAVARFSRYLSGTEAMPDEETGEAHRGLRSVD